MIEPYVLIACAVFLLAGTVKGAVGIGLPVTAVGVLSQFGDARLAVVLALIPIVVSNAWQVFRSQKFMWAVRTYWLLIVIMCVTLFIVSLNAPSVPTHILLLALGVVISAFALINLFANIPALPDKWDMGAQIAAGLTAGIFGGLTAIWGPPVLIYFLARRLDKEQFISAAGTMFLLGSVPLLIGYSQAGMLAFSTLQFSAWLVLPTLLGYFFGEKLRALLPTKLFRTGVLIVFLIIGLNLLRRALFL